MKVIVAGAPKTGTTSVAVALRRLGLIVYDCDEQLHLQQEAWRAILIQGADPVKLFPAMFDGVDAVTDGPGYYFYEQLLSVFPDAKVLLLTRDESSWAESYKVQKELENSYRWLGLLSKDVREIYRLADAAENLSMGSHHYSNWMYRWKFRMHNERVRAIVPNEKLLEFQVGEGWEPLCQFLDVPVPDEAFPRVNVKTGSFKEEFRILRNQLIGKAILQGVAAAAFAIVTVKLCRSKMR